MKCIRCGRSMGTPAVQIKTRGGLVGWGPRCAKYAGVAPTRTRFVVLAHRKGTSTATPVDHRQMALPLEVHA